MSTIHETPTGFLLLDKEVGPTSHDLVARTRRRFPKGTKVGHAGTLDPLASGLMILGVGKATKQLGLLVGLDKQYVATITLGATSITDDAEGPITINGSAHQPTREEIENAVKTFLGPQEQVAPAFSAKKIDGERLYKLARQGTPKVATPHHIRLDKLDITRYEYPELDLYIHCSSGTYIRSLARDLGAVLKTGGYISALGRTAIGPFDITEASSNQLLSLEAIVQRLNELTPREDML